MMVVNKIDTVASNNVKLPPQIESVFKGNIKTTSAITGEGLKGLNDTILELVGAGNVSAQGRKWAVNQV